MKQRGEEAEKDPRRQRREKGWASRNNGMKQQSVEVGGGEDNQ